MPKREVQSTATYAKLHDQENTTQMSYKFRSYHPSCDEGTP